MGKFSKSSFVGVLGLLVLSGAWADSTSPIQEQNHTSPTQEHDHSSSAKEPDHSPSYAECNDQGTLAQTEEAMKSENAALLFIQGNVAIPRDTLKALPGGGSEFQWRKCRVTLRARSDLETPLKLTGLRSRGINLSKAEADRCLHILGPDLRRVKEGGGDKTQCFAFTAIFPDLDLGKKIRKPRANYPDSRIEKIECGMRVETAQLDSIHFEDVKHQLFSTEDQTLTISRSESVSPHWNVGMSACECLATGVVPCPAASSNDPEPIQSPVASPTEAPTSTPTEAPAPQMNSS